jgi:hypothetical protein
MASSILNALGFHMKDGFLSLPDIWNEQEMKKIELGLKQVELALRWFQKGEKEMCANIMVKYSTSSNTLGDKVTCQGCTMKIFDLLGNYKSK